MSKSVNDRFFKKVQKTDSCWIWLGGKDLHFWVDGKNDCARRFSYAIENGPLAHGSFVIHCEINKKCVNPKHLRVIQSKEDLFWNYTVKSDYCWNWVGPKHRLGYGKVCFGRPADYVSAHRFSYELHHDSIPIGKVIRHKCDSPNCVNPFHLEAGTQKDNIYDMVSRDRHSYGERNGMRKLSEEDVKKMRYLYLFGKATRKNLAKIFNISKDQVRNVVLFKHWRHLA